MLIFMIQKKLIIAMIQGIRMCLCILLLTACSSDFNPIIEASDTDETDQQGTEEPQRRTFDISVIASKDGQEYQIDIDNLNVDGDFPVTNLTQELALRLETPYVRNIEATTISYLQGRNQDHRVGQKDVGTSEVFFAENYCPFVQEEGVGKYIYFSRGNERRILYIYTESRVGDLESFFIRIFNKNNGSCQTMALDPNPLTGLRSVILQGNILAMKYNTEENGGAVITLYDVISGEKINTFELDSLFKSATIRNGELLVFGADGSYRVYDMFSKEIMATGLTNGSVAFQNDLFKTHFSGDLMFFNLLYPQPSAIVSQPAVYDLDSESTVMGEDYYLFDLRERMISALGALVLYTTYEVDLESGEIILGYDLNDGSGGGGIVFTNFENEVRKVVQLDYVPEEIIIRNIN